ncbi:ABC-three component system protein [Denitrobacterium detoxificans]|jgi:hypothetical protein|uniref:ABC-three component system protein n=1 Tax=Denitrobacterium detoxificans TaxID=79604 RepID=UPI0026EFCC9E|nr:ABC-three component system protein [Denitrobacterium detoxificans]MBE6466474.1 hypothetical protein [Denitrobacterium detoxificans]
MCPTSQNLDSAWKHWYRLRHQNAYITKSGESFEAYISAVLEKRYPDFINPDPMGRLGDEGCDGLANNGQSFYACYGQRAQSDQDAKAKAKIKSDFERAIQSKFNFSEWCFITNAQIGPTATLLVTELQQQYDSSSARPLTIRIIKSENQFWDEFVSLLTPHQLDSLFPGVPHAQHAKLEELVELIESLETPIPKPTDLGPVSSKKMDYNAIPETTKLELNEGRELSPRIDLWFSAQPDPELRDSKAEVFHRIYEDAKMTVKNPAGIMEQIYIAVGGSDFRLDQGKANAVYAIASYFFDSCDIFEAVPERDES